MAKYCGFLLALVGIMYSVTFAKEGVRFGVGFDYIPVIKLEYSHSTDENPEIVDNLIWQGHLSYDFGNGFKTGVLLDYFPKTFHPGPFRTTDLTLWGVGLTGDYGYEMTDSGHALLVGGTEFGYAHLSDKSGTSSGKAGSFWIAGFAGLRFLIFRTLWLEGDYCISFQEFGPLGVLEKKYIFTASSLRFMLEYPF
jgi:hypothetical protein